MSVIDQGNTSKAGLDEIFYGAFEQDQQPSEVRADNPLFFRQGTTPWGTVQYAESAGPGNFDETGADEEVSEATVRVGNKTSKDVVKFAKDLPITEEYREDSESYGTVNKWVEQMGIRARTTRDAGAFKRSYADAFSGATTPDGIALVSNSHVSINGDTIDNLETGVLAADAFATLIKSLRLQKAHDGDLASMRADGALFPVNLFPTAHAVLASELKPGTGNNDSNYVSNVYPGLELGVSEYLDSTYNTFNSNANTSYFVVSKMHSIARDVRIPLETAWTDALNDRRRRAFYRARFRELVYCGTWCGISGSNGTV